MYFVVKLKRNDNNYIWAKFIIESAVTRKKLFVLQNSINYKFSYTIYLKKILLTTYSIRWKTLALGEVVLRSVPRHQQCPYIEEEMVIQLKNWVTKSERFNFNNFRSCLHAKGWKLKVGDRNIVKATFYTYFSSREP